MDRYEGENDVNTLVIYIGQMKSMTVDITHPVSCMSVVSVCTCIIAVTGLCEHPEQS